MRLMWWRCHRRCSVRILPMFTALITVVPFLDCCCSSARKHGIVVVADPMGIPSNELSSMRGGSPIEPPVKLTVKPPVKVPIKPPAKPTAKVPVKPPAKAPVNIKPAPTAVPRAVQVTMYINTITLSQRRISIPIGNDPMMSQPAEDLALQWLVRNDTLKLLPNSTAAKFRITQRYVLMSMYFQPYSPGTSFPNDSTWFNGKECTWSGVTCATRNIGGGRTQSAITMMRYDYSNLQGAITPELGLLSHLESLSLFYNTLTSILPESLGRLSRLTNLDLGSNAFGGTIPSLLGLLTRLTSLNLANNALSGTIPSSLGLLTRLTSFLVGSNTITGTLPESLKQLTLLTAFGVNNNAIEGTIPSTYASMSLLNDAYFYYNQLSGTLPSSLCALNRMRAYLRIVRT